MDLIGYMSKSAVAELPTTGCEVVLSKPTDHYDVPVYARQAEARLEADCLEAANYEIERQKQVISKVNARCDHLGMSLRDIKAERDKMALVLKAAVDLVCAPAWAGICDEDCELERVLRECGYIETGSA